MLARLSANRFLLENGQEQLDRVAKELAEFRQNNQSLAGALQSGSRQSQAQELVALIDTYEAAFADVSKLIFHRNTIIAERLDPVGLPAAADLESVQAAALAAQDAPGRRAAAALCSALWTGVARANAPRMRGLVSSRPAGRRHPT